MTTTEAERALEKIEQRKAFITGLRELATFLEQHPAVPVSFENGHYFEHTIDVIGLSKGDLLAAVHDGTGKWEKDARGSYYSLSKQFGPITFELTAARDEVCEQVKVGENAVEVPEQPFVAAHTETVPVYEWRCHPLLGE
jgi:hypothetical protein